MLAKYDVYQDTMILYCDNIRAINISKNLIQHSRTKHIDIHHHFITDLVKTKIISLEHVRCSIQLANILTKPLETSLFKNLHTRLRVSKP